MTRTEEEKVCKAPIVVVLGGKEYQIEPLVIRDSRVWRGEVAKALGQLPKYAKVTSDDPEGFEQAMKVMLVENPEQVLDLFFSYAKSLDRDEIEDVASDAEIATAFEEVAAVAFPLAGSLIKLLGGSQKKGSPKV